MTDQKWVMIPVEPTPEMVEVAESAYMPFGDMELAIRMALLAAPAVQGEPAEQHLCPEGIREGAPYDDPAFESLCREHEVWGTAAAAQCAVFWEAGKRVAEQRPAPDVAMRVMEALAAILRKAQGRTDTETGECIDIGSECMAIRREFDRSSKAAPDVAGLVEALESLIKGYVGLLEAGMDRITSLGGDCDPVPVMEQNDPWLRDARAALAAHRKQGSEA